MTFTKLRGQQALVEIELIPGNTQTIDLEFPFNRGESLVPQKKRQENKFV